VLVAHSCNPNYSEGRDQERFGLKPTLNKKFETPYLEKKKSQKRGGGMLVAQAVRVPACGSESKPQYHIIITIIWRWRR
jgi:N-dimethylarginine dimethylaminohydrolase